MTQTALSAASVQLPISIDFETKLVSQADPIPPPVCLSICWSLDEEQDLIHARDPACKRVLRDLVEGAASGQHKLSGFFSAFDMAVTAEHFDLMDQVFAAYAAEGVHCTMVRQKLIDIARGVLQGYRPAHDAKWVEYKYNLEQVASRYGIDGMDKDTWRLRYWELIDTPVVDWEEGARLYALDDTSADLVVHMGQLEYAHFLEDEFRQSETSFDLFLTSSWGVSTDPWMVDKYRKYTQARIDRSRQQLVDAGFLTWQPKKEKYKREDKKVREYAKQVWAQKGVPFPETDTGNVSLDEAACLKSEDELLIAHQTHASAQTQMDRVNELEQGMDGLQIHCRFDELKKSGRTGTSKPNIQNRSTAPVGDRESFVGSNRVLPVMHVPGPGIGYVIDMSQSREDIIHDVTRLDPNATKRNILIDMDFDGLELRTIAQGCIWAVGVSQLAEVLNAGEDPHLMVAARLCQTTYEDAKVRYEQGDPEIIDARGAGKAKMVNFSCWAGTTVKGLWHHAQEVGYNYTMEEAAEIYQAFKDAWPEADMYFKWVKRHGGQAGVGTMMCFKSMRYAGLLSYTESCSIISQGLGADATKAAFRALVKECYVGTDILRGCRMYNYIHDQYQIEVPDNALAHDRAIRAGEIARAEANVWLPDVPTRAKPMLTRRWSKEAKATYDKAGRLIPWDIDMLGQADKKGKPWAWLTV